MSDWLDAVASVIGQIVENLEEFPLGEAELTRDQWRAPDDQVRLEFKHGKLARLGVVEPEVQALLLPLLTPSARRLSRAERKAIVAAGSNCSASERVFCQHQNRRGHHSQRPLTNQSPCG